VLGTLDGKPQFPEAVTKAWSRAMDAIGMPDAGLHSLRHTHVSMLLASGMDILTISRRIDHASVKVTLDTYGRLIHGTDDRAAQIVDAVFEIPSARCNSFFDATPCNATVRSGAGPDSRSVAGHLTTAVRFAPRQHI
jgi:Phage integrase family